MQARTSLASLGTAAVLGLTGAIVVPALASAQTVTHTLKFTAVTKHGVAFSKTTAGKAENDVSKAGTIIGFDTLYYAYNPKTSAARAYVAFDIKGGLLYGALKVSDGPTQHGTVTGGTGAFAGARGTIVGHNLSATRTAVTIAYHV